MQWKERPTSVVLHANSGQLVLEVFDLCCLGLGLIFEDLHARIEGRDELEKVASTRG